MSVDVALLDAANQLSSVPPSLFSDLVRETDFGGLCPLDDSAPDEIKILCARNLDMRLAVLRHRDRSVPSSPATPEIRLESDELSQGETTLLSSKLRTIGNAHQKHITALLRLLYLHVSINSGNLSPYIVSLLVPLYAVLNQEVEPEELVHAEADTFWLFEAMVGEFAELEDEDGGNLWMKNFSQRLAWVDDDLFTDLVGHKVQPTFAADANGILFCSKPKDWILLFHIIHSNCLILYVYGLKLIPYVTVDGLHLSLRILCHCSR
jgi:hypothetical protein